MRTTQTTIDKPIRRIAHFGTFDVENYGDLLFPLILERRLAAANCEWTHVSPVGAKAIWGDCVSTISTETAMSEKFDGIVVGGGHIIHGQASDVAPYVSSDDVRLFAYADLWLGATLLANELAVPIVWNAPGVPGLFPPETAALVDWAASEADYLAVRDHQSRKFLTQSGYAGEIAVELDTALEVNLLWSSEELDLAGKEAFTTRRAIRRTRTIAVHFNTRFLQNGIEETAKMLDDLCRARQATAILLALGPCHGDGSLQREIGGAMKTAPLIIDQPRSLREIAACLRDSELYVGSSLHGAVTATAFGRPAIIVAKEADGGHSKFTGFIHGVSARSNAEKCAPCEFVESWTEGISMARSVGDSPVPHIDRQSQSMTDRDLLDDHWNKIADALFSDRDRVNYRAKKSLGRDRLDALLTQRYKRSMAYTSILLDQARSSAQFRETSQKNARRFRDLDRLYRDLKKADT